MALRSIFSTLLIPTLFVTSCATNSGTSLVGDPVPVPPVVSNTLLNTSQGHTVEITELPLENLPKLPWTKTVPPSPQYLISDDPEYIRVPEAAGMREQVEPGDVRLYVYNVNGIKAPNEQPTRITAVIENLGSEDLTMEFKNYAFMPPTANYYGVGKKGLAQFLDTPADLPPTRTIPPGATIAIDPAMEASTAVYNNLVHGIYEFSIDQPAEVTVLQTDINTPGPIANARIEKALPPKSKSGAGRGKFLTSNLHITTPYDFTLDTTMGAIQLVIADGKDEPWAVGTEQSRPGEVAVLKGNYGIVYDIEIPWTSTDGRGLALVMWNARFNPEAWCGGMAAAINVSEGLHDSGVTLIPSNTLITRQFPEVVLAQIFIPDPDSETNSIHLKYSPPGASCLPTPLVLIPVELE